MSRLNLSSWALTHKSLILFSMILIAVAGLFSHLGLGRAEDPSFTIKVVNIIAEWPGATAQQMQDQVADRIEKKAEEVQYFDHVQTYVKPSFMGMQVIFKDSCPPSEVQHLFYLLRKKLNDIAPQFPAGMIGPQINDEVGDVDSMLYMISGIGSDYRLLKNVADKMQSRLIRIPGVTKVDIYGQQENKIFIEFEQNRIAQLGVSPQEISQSVRHQNEVLGAGTYENQAIRLPMRVSGALVDAADVADVPIKAGGRLVHLGEVANVITGYEDPPSFLIRQRGEPAIGIGVVVERGANIQNLGRRLDDEISLMQRQFPLGISIQNVADQAAVTYQAIGQFERSFEEALIIVLGICFLSLGLRAGVVVALSIPLVLALVFIAMLAMGLDLQRITLGALIIALGLLVDDAIIAVEMMVVKMGQGVDRVAAATYAWDATAFPMLTGTLVTAAGFLPVGFAASSAGEYASGIFWVVILSLVASWFVAVMFTPYLGVLILKPIDVPGRHSQAYDSAFFSRLRKTIAWAVDHRVAVVAATSVLFVLSGLGYWHVSKQFFPISERLELFFQFKLPEASSIKETLAVVEKGEKLLLNDSDATTFTSYVGRGSPRFLLSLNPQLPNASYAEIVIVTKNLEARERIKRKIEKAVADGAFAEARIRVDRFNFGPPIGFPVQVRVSGRDAAIVRDIAYKVRDTMRANSTVVDANLDWNEMMPSLRLVVDQDRARSLGIDSHDIATQLELFLSAQIVTTIYSGTEKIDVVIRSGKDERLNVGTLGDMTLKGAAGQQVAISQIAHLVHTHEDATLWRRDRSTTITVRADVPDGVQATDVSERIWSALSTIRTDLPAGYKLELGGMIEESSKANGALLAVFPVMISVMLTVVMIQLQNFTRLFLVMISAPLGVIGSAVALNLSGAPFGFVALLGLIALAGMDMRNSIILVDQVRQDLERGLKYRDAIIEATVRRSRPVFLTALAAVLALIPLSRSSFWGPMAIVIMGGLSVATLMTVLFLPALYSCWFSNVIEDTVESGRSMSSAVHQVREAKVRRIKRVRSAGGNAWRRR